MNDQNFVKVVETSNVTDDNLEKIINEKMAQSWELDRIHFAMREASRRPAMAFLIFIPKDLDIP